MIEADKRTLVKDIHRSSKVGIRLSNTKDSGVVVQNGTCSSLVAEVKAKQFDDPYLL